MNDFLMPLEERKDREFRSFARMVVIAFLIGLVVAAVIYQTKFGW